MKTTTTTKPHTQNSMRKTITRKFRASKGGEDKKQDGEN